MQNRHDLFKGQERAEGDGERPTEELDICYDSWYAKHEVHLYEMSK